jgi:thiol-disulfide isomerase/thioredoxin
MSAKTACVVVWFASLACSATCAAPPAKSTDRERARTQPAPAVKDAADNAADDADPLAPAKDLTPDEMVKLILDLLNERARIRQTPGFADGVVALADRLLASDTSAGNKSLAVLAKFKVLHEAAVEGEEGAEEKLVALALRHKDDKGPKVSACVRFVEMERRMLAGEKLDAKELPKLLDDVAGYLEREKLTNRQLRMASLTVDAINRLPEPQREPLFKRFGELYAKGSDGDLQTYGKRLGKPPAVAADKLSGQPLAIAGTTAHGEEFKWAGYRNRVVIVDVWATWCGPCRKQMPLVRALYDKYHARGLEVVGVSIDANREALRKYLDENEVPWVTLAGQGSQDLAAKYGIRGIPTMFLIDQQGNIVSQTHAVSGFAPQIDALLAAKTVEPLKQTSEARPPEPADEP